MSIEWSVYSTGNYDGYVNYGEGIVILDEDSAAKEALVFMLVSFQSLPSLPLLPYILDLVINFLKWALIYFLNSAYSTDFNLFWLCGYSAQVFLIHHEDNETTICPPHF